jgi:hypothetical protein
MTYTADPRVNVYIDALPDWQQTICREVRDLVHAADPEVTETIKRTSRPYFVLQGNICALLAARDHVNVFLYDGAIVPDPEGIITGGHDNKTARTVVVRQGETVNAAALTAIVKQIITNNRAGGWRKVNREGSAARAGTAGSASGEFSAGGLGDVGAGVGVSVDAPTAVGGLGDEDPGALHEAGVASGGGDDLGHLLHDTKLLVTVENSDGGQDLDADVVAVARRVGQSVGVQLVDEGSCVVHEERDLGDALPPHHGRGKVLGEFRPVGERSCRGVHVDHWHGALLKE